MEIITLREYARRKAVSLQAIQNGLKAGRIEAVVDQVSGRRTGIDWDTQADAWEANSKHPQKRPHTLAGGRPRLDGQPTAAPATRPQAARPAAPAPAPQPEEGGAKGMTLADIQRARELVKLQIDNEKLKEVRGASVDAAEVEKNGRALAAIVISGMYTIPDRISDELAGMSDPNAIQNLLLQEIDRAVSEVRKTYAPA
jgi:hypothetical protein